MFEDFCLRCGVASGHPSGYCTERCYEQDKTSIYNKRPSPFWRSSNDTLTLDDTSRNTGIAAWAAEVPRGSSPEQPVVELPPRRQSRSITPTKSPPPKPRLIHRQTSMSPTVSMSTPRTAPISTSAPIRTPQQNIASLSQYSRCSLVSPILSYSTTRTNPSTTSASPSTSMTSAIKSSTYTPLQSSFYSDAPSSPLLKEKVSHPDSFNSPKAKDFTVLAMTYRPMYSNESSDHESALGSSYIPSSLLERKLSSPSPHQTPRQRLVPGRRHS
ncbi:hypothetical protein BDV98DRAFT_590913 [Pterulicium gracile]|uniref:Uncharacterized protein n=1 Tax=Pterulicium gracile TaxID=1884261 RepID=A0A5C3QPX6_9AGAR|nr:hypothetical protein BDV98DRAFT_590913 [Pterula gracilis]